MEVSLLLLLLVLALAWSAGLIANRFGFPAILGELAAGVIFGPALLGSIGLGFSGPVPGLNVLAEIGIFALMLYIGMEVDYRDLIRNGKAGFLGAFGGFVVPFGAGFGLAVLYGFTPVAGIFLGLAMGVTSLATKSRILADLNLFGTRVASVLLSGALLADVAALIIFALTLGMAESGRIEAGAVLFTTIKAGAYFALAALFGLKVLPWLGEMVRKIGLTERTGNFTFVLLIGLIYAESAHLLGLHPVVGAFLAGIFLREGVLKRRLSHEISSVARDLSLGFLAPIFFFTVGFHVSLAVLTEKPVFVVLVLVIATVSKIFGTALFYAFSGNNWREGIVIGAGMNGRGAVEIIVAEIALKLGIIDDQIFSALVIMAFFTTLTVPVGLRLGVSWLEKRGELVTTSDDRRGVVIVGAGPLGQFITRAIQELSSDPVCLVDSNAGRVEAARQAGLPVVRGNAMREDVLILAGAREAYSLVAMTRNASINHLVCEEARTHFGVPKVLVGWKEFFSGEETRETTFPSLWKFHEEDEDLIFWRHRAFRHPQDRKTIVLESEEHWKEITGSEELLPVFVLRKDRVLFPEGLRPKEGDKAVCLHRPAPRSIQSGRFAKIVEEAPFLELAEEMDFSGFLDRAAEALASSLPMKPEEMKDLFRRREREFSSVMIPGLAIPHARVPGDLPLHLLIARCKSGVTFPGQEEPVRGIFLLIGGEQERELHLHALASIATLASSPDFDENWRREDPERLKERVQRASRGGGEEAQEPGA